MVPGDVGMQILPNAFNPVVIGAVGRQENQANLRRKMGQSDSNDLAAVNAVVVENYVDYPRSWINRHQPFQQVQEQPTVLLVCFHPVNLASTHIECASQ